MRRDLPAIKVLGVPVAALDRAAALAELDRILAAPGPSTVAYVNAHSLNVAQQVPRYREVLHDARLILNDGVGLSIAARVQGKSFPANLNGTDLNPEILRMGAARGCPVFLLGGRPGVAAAAADRLTALIPDLRVVGSHHGQLTSPAENAAVVAEIVHSGAELIMVGMGNPIQELWLADHLGATGARLGVAVGAFLDFASGRIERAPSYLRRARLEWLFRLLREPRRLFHRYVFGNPVFLARVIRDRFIHNERAAINT